MWERGVYALSYSWQSQPLWDTIGNLVDIQRITIRAKGQGTVKVTLTGETSVSQEVTFEVNSTLPVLYRQNTRIQDANIAVKIVATGSTAAPTIYECNLGHVAAQLEADHT
jgi:hypothetical protein